MNYQKIMEFLNFGYVLDFQNNKYTFNFNEVNKNLYKNLSFEELEELAYIKFMNSIKNCFIENKKHVIPLSGGLDSRAILAALLEFTEASNIITYTFGTPNTLDYEIGNNVANKIGTIHHSYSLENYNYNLNELIDIAKRVQHQTVLFHHPPIKIIKEEFPEGIIWSGFFGDPLVGSRLQKENLSYQASLELFLQRNTYQNKISLVPPNYRVNINNLDYEGNKYITPFEELDFLNRQLKFVAPHVLMEGFYYRTPFLNKHLYNFFLSVDDKYRLNQRLYKKMLLNRFPKLFSMPTKNNYGLPLKTTKYRLLLKKSSIELKNRINKIYPIFINSYINYADFERGFREREDLKNIAIEQINDLNKRKLITWMDVLEPLNLHLKNKGDYSKALIILISLEIHLKSLINNS